MLERLSGNTVTFFTAVCIAGPNGVRHEHLDQTRCVFRSLSSADIDSYVEAEPATDCAGGFKSESLGMTLLERLETIDPTALIGLPMIWVAGTLRALDA
jgi:septum formation protein